MGNIHIYVALKIEEEGEYLHPCFFKKTREMGNIHIPVALKIEEEGEYSHPCFFKKRVKGGIFTSPA